MEMFTYTKVTPQQETATLNQLIANINDPQKQATDGLGKATSVKVFCNARMTGRISEADGQIIGKALHNDLKAISENVKRNPLNRERAGKALAMFKQWRKDRHNEKLAAEQPVPVAPVVAPVAPVAPPVVAPVVTANAAMAPAASLTDLTAMVMSLTASVNTLLANA